MADISSLNGYEKNDVNIKNAVYRVKNNDNTDTYSRIHFETSSKMIHDATDAATGNMVARRDGSGGIKFANITGTNITSSTITNSGTAQLKGATTIGASVTSGAALIVPSGKATSLGGTLGVTGTSAFIGKTTHSGGADIQNGLTASGGVTISGNASITGTGTINTLNVTANSALGGATNTTTVAGTADINILKVKDANVVSNLNADRVDGCHVSDTTTTNTNLWTASKVDTTKANKTISISGAGGLTGGGTLEANRTISHATQTVPTPSSLGTEPSKTTNNVIASLTVTNLGHVTGIRTTDLDQRYPTKTQVATDIANAGLAVSRDLIAKSPSNRSDNGNNLIMQNFTMQYNSTTQSIDFVFV